MNKINTCIVILAVFGAAVLQSGCATQTSASTSSSSSRTKAPATVTAKKEPTRPGQSNSSAQNTAQGSGYGPSYSTFERNGVTHVAGSMAYPSGIPSSSSVLVEKIIPKEIMAGAPYSIEYVVKNITDVSLKDVVLSDQIGENFKLSRSSPEADEMDGNKATWIIGDLGPNETRRIEAYGSSPAEGYVNTCADLTFTPAFCETIRIVKGDLQLVKRLPPNATTCDVIPMTLVVTNTGTGRLTNVVVTDDLPRGLMTADGQTRLNYNVGTLNPGENRQFDVSLKASATGSYENVANVTSAQNITATDSAKVLVQAPELAITCDAPDERFVGRPFTVCYTIVNGGSAVSTNTKLSVPIPAGVNFQGSTGNGRIEGNSVVWNVGSMAPESTKEICATFTSKEARRFNFAGTVSGDCASAKSTTCSVNVQGIPAILLEVIDLQDPIEVGSNVVYEIKVTNQGSAPDSNVKITCLLEPEQAFVSATGASTASVTGNRVDLRPVPVINPGQVVSWRVTVKAAKAAQAHFSVTMNSDQSGRAVSETESTNQY